MEKHIEDVKRANKVLVTLQFFNGDEYICKYNQGIEFDNCIGTFGKIKTFQSVVKALYRTFQQLIGVNIKEKHSTVIFTNITESAEVNNATN